MKKDLKKYVGTFYFVDGRKKFGAPSWVYGDLSEVRGDLSGVYGDLSGVRGDLSGVYGDLSGVYGDLSGVYGDLDDCDLSDDDRKKGVTIKELIFDQDN